MFQSRRWFPYVALATLMFSTSAVFVRWASPVSPYVITWARLVVATLTVGALAPARRQPIRLTRKDLPRFLVFGGITAAHFFCYIAALSYTTIAHALTLAYTAPIFVTLFSALFLKEPIARRKTVGVAITVVGIAILAGFEAQMDRRMLIGDALSLGSGLAYGFYSIAGRSQRDRYPLFTYAIATYGAAVLWMTPAALPTLTAGWGWRQGISILLSGVFPLGLGHTLYNAALRRTHATYVNIVASQEVTGGILLGWLILGESPTWNSALGAAVALLGIALVLVQEPRMTRIDTNRKAT